MDISGTPREISIGDGEAGGFSEHGDCLSIVPLHTAQAIPVSIKTPPSPREVFQEEPSAEDKPAASPAQLAQPGSGLGEAQGPSPLGGSERKPEAPGSEASRRRALPFPGAAEWDDPRDPAVKRKMLEAHQRLYQVLEGLPKTLSAMSESMEESTSAMCGVVSHVVSTLQATLESASTPRESAVAEPPQPESPAPTLEALIEAQTAAVRALGADVCSALERLTGRLDTLAERVDRGFETVSHLLRCALPRAGGSEEAEGGAASGQASFALTRGACPPFPPSPPPRAAEPTTTPPPNGQLSQGALAAGPAALPPQGPAPRARAPRSQRSQPSQEPPALSCLTAGTSRRSGKVGLSH
ncbi:large proline-rich protein BAG6-like isoform X2 [Hemiscyllium ocellatum]|nr:large proline-rich protein BAG6-like isoform X2 [Hemiscyllium ocellatum]